MASNNPNFLKGTVRVRNRRRVGPVKEVSLKELQARLDRLRILLDKIQPRLQAIHGVGRLAIGGGKVIVYVLNKSVAAEVKLQLGRKQREAVTIHVVWD